MIETISNGSGTIKKHTNNNHSFSRNENVLAENDFSLQNLTINLIKVEQQGMEKDQYKDTFQQHAYQSNERF